MVNPVTIKLASRSGTNELAKHNFAMMGAITFNNGEVHKELNCNILTNCGLVTPYDGIDLGPTKGTRCLPAPSHSLN